MYDRSINKIQIFLAVEVKPRGYVMYKRYLLLSLPSLASIIKCQESCPDKRTYSNIFFDWLHNNNSSKI
jgi:hypothetical protein